MRRADKEIRAGTVKRMSYYIWGMLLVIWVVYGLIVAEALLKKK